jgi:hypothetical protein
VIVSDVRVRSVTASANCCSWPPRQWLSCGQRLAVNIVNATVQVVFYRADEPIVLGIAHIATGPVFATLVAVTLICARRAIPASCATSTPTPTPAARTCEAGAGGVCS